MSGPLCLLSWDRLGLGGQEGHGLRGRQLQLLHQDGEPKSPKGRSERRGGVPRGHWADASSWSRGFLGTAGGRVCWPCWLTGLETESDDIVGSGLLPRGPPGEVPALGSIDGQTLS